MTEGHACASVLLECRMYNVNFECNYPVTGKCELKWAKRYDIETDAP